MEPDRIESGSDDSFFRYTVIVIAVFFISAALFIFITENPALQNMIVDEEDNSVLPGTAQSTFILEEFFPNTNRFAVKSDPDNQYELLFKSNFAITKFNVRTREKEVYDIRGVAPEVSIGDFVRVEELLIFGTEEGVGVYDILQKKVDLYTPQDGLAHQSNIRLHPDPYDKNIVWVGTFRGLSKFDLTTRSFTSYAEEIGVPGSSWEPEVFYIDAETVWVVIGANGYNPGGVARLYKETEVWTVWSTETFTAGPKVNDRVDPLYIHEGSPTHIVIGEDSIEYVFDRSTETWSVLRQGQLSDPVRTGQALVGNWFYYTERDELYGYNLQTKVVATVDYLALLHQHTTKDIEYADIFYDTDHQRFVVTARNLIKHPDVLSLRVVAGEVIQAEPYSLSSSLYDFEYTDITILDVTENELLFKSDEIIMLYDLRSGYHTMTLDATTQLAGGSETTAKIYPDYVAFHVADYCETFCRQNTGYKATTTVFNKSTKQLVMTVPFVATSSSWKMFFDDQSMQGTLRSDDSRSTTAFVMSFNSPTYTAIFSEPVPMPPYAKPGDFVPVVGSQVDTQYQERPSVGSERNELRIKTVDDNGMVHDHVIRLRVYVNAFEIEESYLVTDTFYAAPYLWLMTNRGLVRFNEQTKEGKVFTSKDGLRLEQIPVLAGGEIFVGNKIVIKDELGVGIYDYTNSLE